MAKEKIVKLVPDSEADAPIVIKLSKLEISKTLNAIRAFKVTRGSFPVVETMIKTSSEGLEIVKAGVAFDFPSNVFDALKLPFALALAGEGMEPEVVDGVEFTIEGGELVMRELSEMVAKVEPPLSPPKPKPAPQLVKAEEPKQAEVVAGAEIVDPVSMIIMTTANEERSAQFKAYRAKLAWVVATVLEFVFGDKHEHGIPLKDEYLREGVEFMTRTTESGLVLADVGDGWDMRCVFPAMMAAFRSEGHALSFIGELPGKILLNPKLTFVAEHGGQRWLLQLPKPFELNLMDELDGVIKRNKERDATRDARAAAIEAERSARVAVLKAESEKRAREGAAKKERREQWEMRHEARTWAEETFPGILMAREGALAVTREMVGGEKPFSKEWFKKVSDLLGHKCHVTGRDGSSDIVAIGNGDDPLVISAWVFTQAYGTHAKRVAKPYQDEAQRLVLEELTYRRNLRRLDHASRQPVTTTFVAEPGRKQRGRSLDFTDGTPSLGEPERKKSKRGGKRRMTKAEYAMKMANDSKKDSKSNEPKLSRKDRIALAAAGKK